MNAEAKQSSLDCEGAGATFFSIIIPAHNEAPGIATTCSCIMDHFRTHQICDYEVILINDHSTDDTSAVIARLSADHTQINCYESEEEPGFGNAIRKGLSVFRGQAACIVMGDLSDSPEDIISYYLLMKQGAECVFGSRFIPGASLEGYPWVKLILNRMANYFIKLLFRISHNDITNAFKCYHRKVIEGVQPLFSKHFNLAVELPLKAIARGFNYRIIPITWTNRKWGKSNLKIKEMGSRYLFIILYVWLEKMLSKGDYRRKDQSRDD
ncbi:MAG: glycosyltransferase family 2 protein [Verrucomicrobia bacterium]|nr:glycosyltransferase family 2 protein [Verrucomicrobiota bacterium]